MPTFFILSDQILNLDNVVALDIDGPNVVRVWYAGSPTPLQLAAGVPAQPLIAFMKQRGLLTA